MTAEYYRVDPTGNITLLVKTPVPEKERVRAADALMKAEPGAEQVGFIDGKALNMAGGEFCGNASLSAAAVYCLENGLNRAEIDLTVSGADKPVIVSIKKEGKNEFSGSVEMPAPLGIKEVSLSLGGKTLSVSAVEFPGITHIILTEKADISDCEKAAVSACGQLGAEALGIMLIDGSSLTPVVYVPASGTLVRESSCASGTAAAGVYFAHKNGGCFRGEFEEPGGKLKIEVRPAEDGTLIPTLTGKAGIVKKDCINIQV